MSLLPSNLMDHHDEKIGKFLGHNENEKLPWNHSIRSSMTGERVTGPPTVSTTIHNNRRR
jgi:hypothetical protein